MDRSAELQMKANYERNLKANAYNEKFNRIFKLIPFNFEFILQFLHDIIQSGRFSGSKVLDVGSGATVHNVAAASSRFSSIVQCDYVMDNVEELRRWHQGESTLDWSQFLNLAADIERKSGHTSITLETIQSRIRKSVRCVLRGDLLSSDVLSPEDLQSHGVEPPFDLVISVLCIETVASDLRSYEQILLRINRLLRRGGGLLLCGYENGSPWIVDEKAFNHVKLDIRQISDALAAAGFGKLDMRINKKIKSDYEYDYDSLFCVAAEKL